ncbi:hypothetical protein FRC06_003051, partial [Ceratobasidium sp. 370]
MPKAPNHPRGSHHFSPVPSGSPTTREKLDNEDKIYNLSPAAGLLPVKLDYTHKAWLNRFISEFNSKRAKRSCRKDNATIWTHDFFVNRFIPHFFPDVDLTSGDKKWLCDSLGEKVYNFFGNCAKRRTSAKPPKVIVRTKCFAQDAYRHVHPEEHDTTLKSLLAEKSPELVDTKLNVGQLRHYSSLVFKQLSAEDQCHWKQVAKDELTVEQEASRLTDPLACDRYVTGLIKTFQQIIVEAGQKANVCISMQLVAEQSNCRFKLSNLVSSNLGDFGQSNSLVALLHAIKAHVEKTVEGGQVEGDAPERDIIISKNSRPLLLEITVEEGRVGRVPFEEIGCSLHEWFDPKHLLLDFIWMDPSSMTLANVLVPFDWILQVQSRELGLKCMPQFLKVNAGPKPIDASASQETSCQDVYFLRFDKTVTKCHAVDGVEGMRYLKSLITYTLWRQTGNLDAAKTASSITSLAPAPPAEWLDLPFGAAILRTTIFGAKEETLMTLAPMLPQEHHERLENIVRLVNEHQAHLPASNERGLWAAPANPPTIIPPNPCCSPPNPLFAPIWATCYFKIPSSMEETIFHVEVWLKSVLKSGVLIHEPSGTLFGDDMGVVWIIRILIKVFLSFVAVKYNISFPGEIPTECDISHLPLGEWPRVLAQLDSWAQRLRDSIAILQHTSKARTLGLPSADDDDDLQSYEPIAYESTLEPSSPVKQRRPSKKKSKQRLGGLEGGESEASLESEDDSLEDEEMDFDAMDRRGRDSDEESNDEKERDGEGKDSEEDEGEDAECANTAGLFDSSGGGGSGRSTPTPSSVVASGTLKSIEARVPAPTLPPWKRRTNAFSSFIVLDQWRITTLKNVGLALDALGTSIHTWRTAANEFRMLSDLYTKLLDIDSDLLTAVQHSPAPLLTEYILRCWKHTESLAQSLFEARDDCEPEIERLKTRVDVTGRTLAEACWTWIELHEFQSKATEYLNKLQGNWLAELIPTNLADLHRLVLSQVEWADAFAKMKLTQAKHRQSIWKTAVLLEPFPAQHLSSGMQFALGNLTDGEEPSGFHDALAQVTEDLAGPQTSTQVVSKPNSAAMTNSPGTVENINITGAPSSIPAMQQNPTLERSNIVVQDAARELHASPTGTAAPSSSVKTMSSVETNSPVETAPSLVASVASITPTTPAAPAAPAAPATPAAPAAPAAPTAPTAPAAPAAPAAPITPTIVSVSPAPDPAADTVPP